MGTDVVHAYMWVGLHFAFLPRRGGGGGRGTHSLTTQLSRDGAPFPLFVWGTVGDVRIWMHPAFDGCVLRLVNYMLQITRS